MSGRNAEERRGRKGTPEALRKWKRPNWALLAPAGAGMLLTAYLALSFWTDTSPAYCGAGSSCDRVQSSHWSTLLGLPVAFWGFLTYSALALVAWRVRARGQQWAYAWGIALLGLAVSGYLTAVSVLALEAACAYCLASLALMATCFGVVASQHPAGIPGFRWPAWLGQTLGAAALGVLVLHLHYAGFFHPSAGPEDPYLRDLAIHLERSGARFYGAYWCDHCKEQKKAFGPAARRLPYVECAPDGPPPHSPSPECERRGVENYPTWEIDGELHMGVQKPAQLARYSGFPRSGEARGPGGDATP